MTVYQRILIGTDGSDAANLAVQVAAELAGRLALPVSVVMAVKGDADDARSWLEPVGRAATELFDGHGVSDVTLVERGGSPGDVLIAVGRENPDALLVVGARGLGSTTARIFGSTSNALSHRSPIDVLFVQKEPVQWHAIGLSTDGSPTSVRAVERGAGLAQALGAQAFLVTAAKSEEEGDQVLDAVEQQVAAPDGGYERDVITGVPADEALVNAGWKYDILVIGNRGMSGPARLLGSVANKVTHDYEANLLLVNTTATPI
ncbi:universal stress protein [Skermania piniformis]|uniref:Universal stress protein n=1 Tax=Skermania pinensis TaxID=39122 RepID=A0ABX8S5I7_9ACTN|nr:universal stress protein [Skermania piniformis]QXQ13103.1 universal stress protein [Skermania piniformis]